LLIQFYGFGHFYISCAIIFKHNEPEYLLSILVVDDDLEVHPYLHSTVLKPKEPSISCNEVYWHVGNSLSGTLPSAASRASSLVQKAGAGP
jgi:hypothetical protein